VHGEIVFEGGVAPLDAGAFGQNDHAASVR
jgi:hypothetical protein